jgi:uncharacterized RDD family membrane protein YckC
VSTREQASDLVLLQGHYAGAISRLASYLIDLAVASAFFVGTVAITSYSISIVTGQQVHLNKNHFVAVVLYLGWMFVYFGYCWGVGGRTIGMALLGVRVVRADGTIVDLRRGVVRALVFPLSFLLFGLGFIGILVQREHRALHDLIAGTAVIYSWDARAARLRLIARESHDATAVISSSGVDMRATTALPADEGSALTFDGPSALTSETPPGESTGEAR